jgi:hypothetical protein
MDPIPYNGLYADTSSMSASEQSTYNSASTSISASALCRTGNAGSQASKAHPIEMTCEITN